MIFYKKTTNLSDIKLENEQESVLQETIEYVENEKISTVQESNHEEYVLKGCVISSIYEDYDMYWDDICVLIIAYTAHFDGMSEFGLIGYNGTENPVLFMGNTRENGYGEYDVYCFQDNRVYKSDETIKGKIYYNSETKEFATVEEDGLWNMYTYYSNHIIWLGEETNISEQFEPMILTSSNCSPPPMVENIREFIY